MNVDNRGLCINQTKELKRLWARVEIIAARGMHLIHVHSDVRKHSLLTISERAVHNAAV